MAKTLIEALNEAAEREGQKVEIRTIEMRDYKDIADFINAEKESSRRARECKIPIGGYLPSYAFN
jgi:hypothetical protein